jgi:DNA-binding NtrC family response regulator
MSHILVIEDDAQIRGLLRHILERAGYEVSDAPDGAVGIAIHRNKPADLVITDILMPQKEGLETIMEMRRDSPAIKIIAITGGGRVGTDLYLNLAKNLGAIRTVRKPFENQQILEMVKELLSS